MQKKMLRNFHKNKTTEKNPYRLKEKIKITRLS